MDFEAHYRQQHVADIERRRAEYVPIVALRKRIIKQSVDVLVSDFSQNPPELRRGDTILVNGVPRVAWNFADSYAYEGGQSIHLLPGVGYVEVSPQYEFQRIIDVDMLTPQMADDAMLAELYDGVVLNLNVRGFDISHVAMYASNADSRGYPKEQLAAHPPESVTFPIKRQ